MLTENVEYACNYINEKFDGVNVSKPQGTYMLYVDCAQWCKKTGIGMDELLTRTLEAMRASEAQINARVAELGE